MKDIFDEMISPKTKESIMYKHPKVSIVIPVYNGANYMHEAIDSTLAQTYDNIEIIVVNDGSRDDGKTDEIALSYGDRIRYFTKPNGGCASALNLGISKMTGEYFSWLSHDDVYMPEKIEHQINALHTSNSPDTIIYGGYELIDSQSKSLGFVRPDSKINEDKRDIPLLPLLRGLIHGCSLLIPTKYFREIGVFDETLLCTQDYALWFEFLRVAPIYFDSRILIKSRIHPEQSTHKIDSNIEECNELWSGFLKKLTENEMTEMEGSPFLFLHNTTKFLADTPYHKARDLASSMTTNRLAATQISVIMPVYNRIDWAIEAIDSCLAQTHQAFELIVVDDGSTDDISDLLKKCNSDNRIKYVHKKNGGPGSARNFGITRASGKYIAFLDSDDLFYPHKLEVQLKFMEENDFKFSHTSYKRMDLVGKNMGNIHSGTFSGKVFPEIICSCPIAMPTVMGLTSIFISNPFTEKFHIGEDVCTWISIASMNLVGAIDLSLSKVRVGNSTSAIDPKKSSIGMMNIANFVINHKYFGQFGVEIASLLISTASIFEDMPKPVSGGKYIVNTNRKRIHGIFSKLIDSLRNDGIVVTCRRIYYKRQVILRKLLGL